MLSKLESYCQTVSQRVVAICNHANKAQECWFLHTSTAPGMIKLKNNFTKLMGSTWHLVALICFLNFNFFWTHAMYHQK